ncbi:hypothetical protein FO519_004895 [Halicephalobus sp. NKZ332]|nr:hypothetical protein FO519_004895 [Halicephalobus sp. NKZ332]
MRISFLTTVLLSVGLGLAQDDEPISIAPETNDSDSGSDSSNPLGLIGVVTLWPQGSLGKGQGRPRPDHCPKFGDWKNVTCWWPSVAFSDLPQECTRISLPKKVPSVIQQLIKSKVEEVYNAIVYEYNQRGKPPKCGYCSRSFRCRSRNATDDDSDSGSDFNFDRRRKGRGGQCRLVQLS